MTADLHQRGAGRRGSALIAILWIVSILSLAVFSATQFLFIELESESNASSRTPISAFQSAIYHDTA